MTSGSSSKREVPVSRASKAGSRSRSSASANRSDVVRRRAAGRRDGTDLAGADAQPAGVKCAPERQRDVAIAVPAEVDDRALAPEEVERLLEPSGRRACVHDEVAPACGIRWQREVDAQGGRDLGAVGVDVDESHVGAREAARADARRSSPPCQRRRP